MSEGSSECGTFINGKGNPVYCLEDELKLGKSEMAKWAFHAFCSSRFGFRTGARIRFRLEYIKFDLKSPLKVSWNG
jgi:hypothetical protein